MPTTPAPTSDAQALRLFAENNSAINKQLVFDKAIDEWAFENKPMESRAIAAARIKQAYREKLPTLSLEHLHLSSLPSALFSLESIEQLFLKYNNLSVLPDDIAKLKKLTQLCISFNALRTLPDSLCQLKFLSILYAGGNNLRCLPSQIGLLTDLSELNLVQNELTQLPDSLCDLENLYFLDAGDNKLTSLPEHIGRLKKLDFLSVGCNELHVLPNELGNLSSLRSLYLQNNFLRTLPSTFCQLTKLSKLNMTENLLNVLPQQIGSLKLLQNLYLEGNCLIELPESMGDLVDLSSLDVSRNHLRALPESIGHLKKLETLDVSFNQLAALPPTIGNLDCLESLYAGSNRLCVIPESLTYLEKIQLLNLESNQILSIPDGLRSIPNLLLEDNPILDVPDANERLINFSTEMEKMLSLLKNTCAQIDRNKSWAMQCSSFINQLLMHIECHHDLTRGIDNEVQRYLHLLQQSYEAVPTVSKLIFAARRDNLYFSEEHLIFMSASAQENRGLIMSKEFYKVNLLNRPGTELSWIALGVGERCRLSDTFSIKGISNPSQELSDFPFIHYQFLANHSLGNIKRALSSLELDPSYQSRFEAALKVRAYNQEEEEKKLIHLEHQQALSRMFSYFCYEKDGGYMITAAHYRKLTKTLPVQEADKPAWLLGLAILFTRYSSSAIFGTELDSPEMLRRYALALLNTALTLDERLLPAELVKDYRDCLLQKNDALGCTSVLFEKMVGDIKRLISQGNASLKLMLRALVPPAWQ